MINLITGFVLGIFVTAVTSMVVYCIRYEHKHPEVIDEYRKMKTKNEFHRETHY